MTNGLTSGDNSGYSPSRDGGAGVYAARPRTPYSMVSPSNHVTTSTPKNPQYSFTQAYPHYPYSYGMYNTLVASQPPVSPVSYSNTSYLASPFSPYASTPNTLVNSFSEDDSLRKAGSGSFYKPDFEAPVSQPTIHLAPLNYLPAKFEYPFSLTKEEAGFNSSNLGGSTNDNAKVDLHDHTESKSCECTCHLDDPAFRLELYMKATSGADSGHFYSRLPFRPYFDYTTPLADYVYRDKHALVPCPEGKYAVGNIKKCCQRGYSLAQKALEKDMSEKNSVPKTKLTPQALMRSFLSQGEAIADTCLVTGGEMPEKLSNETKNVVAWFRKMKRAVFSQEKFGGLDKQQLHCFLLKSVKYNLRCQVSYTMVCDGADYEDPIAWSQYLLELTYNRFDLRSDLRGLVSELHKTPTNDMESRRFVRLHSDYQDYYSTPEGYLQILLSNFDNETAVKIEAMPEVSKLLTRFRVKKEVDLDTMKKVLHEAIILLFSPTPTTPSAPVKAAESGLKAVNSSMNSKPLPQLNRAVPTSDKSGNFVTSAMSTSKQVIPMDNSQMQKKVGFGFAEKAVKNSYQDDKSKGFMPMAVADCAKLVKISEPGFTRSLSLGSESSMSERSLFTCSPKSNLDSPGQNYDLPGRTSTPHLIERSDHIGLIPDGFNINQWNEDSNSVMTDEDDNERAVTQGSTCSRASTPSASIRILVGSYRDEPQSSVSELTKGSSPSQSLFSMGSVTNRNNVNQSYDKVVSRARSSHSGNDFSVTESSSSAPMTSKFINSFTNNDANPFSSNDFSRRLPPSEFVWIGMKFVESTNNMFVKVLGLPPRMHCPFVHPTQHKPGQSIITREERLYRFRHELCPSCGNHFRDKDTHCFTGDEKVNLGKNCVLHPYYYIYFGHA